MRMHALCILKSPKLWQWKIIICIIYDVFFSFSHVMSRFQMFCERVTVLRIGFVCLHVCEVKKIKHFIVIA